MARLPSLMPCPLRQQALTAPEQPLLDDPDSPQPISAALVDTWVEQYRQALASQGLSRPDRLAVVTHCPLDTVLLLLACLRSGIVFCPINPAFPLSRVQAYSAACDVQWIYPDVPALTGVRLPPRAAVPALLREPLWLDATAIMDLVATSGTTGVPKAVAHHYLNHFYSAQGAAQVMPLTPADCWLLSLPLFHVGGLAIVLRCLLAGARIRLYRRPARLSEALNSSDVSHLSLVNTQLYRLLKLESVDLGQLGVRCIILGGGAASPALVEQARAQGVRVLTTYGMTEMSSQVCTGEPVLHGATVSSGQLLAGRELRLAADGEILVRGKPLAPGYWRQGQLQPLVSQDGWYSTGDRGEWYQGQLLVRGRIDHMMISGGENIYPEEIEQALISLPEIVQAVVVAVSSGEFGQRPVAYVQTESGRLDELFTKRQLAGKMAKFKIPDRILLFPDGDTYSGIKVNRRLFQQLANRQFPSSISCP